MKREATITPDGLYRLDLTRTVEPDCMCKRCEPFTRNPTAFHRTPTNGKKEFVLWVLANPSKANAEEDDPTERRGWGFTSSWGFGKMVFVNTTPYRSTDPKLVQPIPISVVALNSYYQRVHAEQAAIIVCAWGASVDKITARTTALELKHHFGNKLFTLGLTADGTPKHPLYLKSDLTPQPWNPT